MSTRLSRAPRGGLAPIKIPPAHPLISRKLCVCWVLRGADGFYASGRMLTQTQNYLDAFARFRQKENVEAVERLLSAHKQLAKFERAQIGIPSSRQLLLLRNKHS